ncbi:MAG: vitamin B12 dependent methionine synthase [Desulfobacteraceae bacterium]|nr:vitamin B12 dependent methionine synthase [Desulfobacteraceae bacterium]MBL7217390.1 vitamin B12 dependent methionine synthase [Desulfobacteraceae bacterium]
MEILDKIQIDLNAKKIGEKLHVQKTGSWDQFQGIFEATKPLITPKAVYVVRYIGEKLEDAVVIDGICLKSRVLRKNLETVGRVFPYVVTIGPGLEAKADASQDLLEKYYLDSIGNAALIHARKYLQGELRARFAMEGLSFMSPGSLEDWPIEEQRSLFSLLEGVENAIGVKLNESLLMIPRKSVSGLYFPTKVTFYSCQLCPRKPCEGRKAAYKEDLAREYGILK